MFGRLARRVGRFVLADLSPPPYCENVKAWCSEHPDTCRFVLHIADSVTVTRRPPFAPAESSIHWLFEKHRVHTFPPQYLVAISNAKLAGQNGLVILPNGEFAVEPVYAPEFLKRDRAYRRYLPWEIRRKQGAYYPLMLLSTWHGNYYHWLTDVLPRLYPVLDLLPDHVQFITPDPLHPFQRETLQILGIPPERWTPFSLGEVWDLETLYFLPPVAFSAHHLPEATCWLRRKLMDAYGVRPLIGGGLRLFVSREKARNRRIVNMEELTPILKAFGFEIVLAEDLTLEEQVRLFSQADVIAGPHGAGLTNMLFAKPHARVIEIFGDQAVHYTYWTLCEALGYDYAYVIGENIPAPQHARMPRRALDLDMYVPPEKLCRTLEYMLL